MPQNEEHFSSDEITEMLAYAVDAETGHCVYTGGVFIYYLSISLFILAHWPVTHLTEYSEKTANYAPLFWGLKRAVEFSTLIDWFIRRDQL